MQEHNSCLELALEGERLCKAGDFRSGVAFFEASIQAGTDDLKTLSAIYSQLGNASFFIGDYTKAVNFHKHDLTLARTMGDKLGEAKASGNLGNTLKVMGKFDEAILCCKRHLDITTALDDKVGRARALYNLANAYHCKGKHVGRLGQQDPGEFPEEVKESLGNALVYYEQNLQLTKELNDRSGEGRASGNLGNVHYLMGNFEEAIRFHEKRLEIAKEFGDKNAQRRAYTNLGNAQVFSGNFELAAGQYKKSLLLSQELLDRAIEAQACYSLGNTYTLLRNYPLAIEYHLRHLHIAQQLADKVGEGRAYWSLGNAHSAQGEHAKALYYAKQHLVVSGELGDQMGSATAQMNVDDLRRVVGEECDVGGVEEVEVSGGRRKSMEEMKLIKMTPEVKEGGKGRSYSVGTVLFKSPQLSKLNTSHTSEASDEEEEDAFFDMLTKAQTSRLNDQRCEMPNTSKKHSKQRLPTRANSLPVKKAPEKPTDDLLDLIFGMQSKRMDEQRASLPEPATPDDEFFDMLMRCQGSRLEEQRADLEGAAPARGLTVPDEDFFSLIERLQDRRIDDQRVELRDSNRNNV